MEHWPDFGRFSKAALMIVASLAGGEPKHGYALMQDIDQHCQVQLSAGTLYGALARLHRLGLIEPVASNDRRRPYRITRAGAEWLKVELKQQEGIRALAGALARA
jgi:DNA-binding PadR family transcriptional regulator